MSAPEDQVVLNVLLNCELTKSSETKQVHFQSLPITPLEIKKKIEEDFSIPSCVQTLHYQSMILKDSDQLQHTHFRSGDTFTVDYPIEAECEVIQKTFKWLKEVFELLKYITEESISSPADDEEPDSLISSNLETLILDGERDTIVEALTWSLFGQSKKKKTLMNRTYFLHIGGLDVLMKVYGILVSKEWGELGIERRFHIYLENVCSRAICGNAAHSSPHQHQVVKLGGLEMCMKAVLRWQSWRHGRILGPLVYDTLSTALIALCR
jgi:hypothetical protein